MQQYFEIKVHYSDALLLFQVGDFYELFYDDAKKAAAFLGITLTARGKNNGEPIPLCGVPVHALDHYLTKLVRGGFHVAICNQLEEPKPGTIVKRGVTQVLTPGTLTDAKLLDEKSASYLLSFFPLANEWGLLFGELLTAQLFATVLPHESVRLLEAELVRFFPDEIVLPDTKQAKKVAPTVAKLGYCTSFNAFDTASSEGQSWIDTQFTESMRHGLERSDALKNAMINFYWYIRRNQEQALAQFKQVHFYNADDFLILDPATQRNLELIKNNQDSTRKNTLFSLLDGAMTPMGSRTIKKWLVRPLLKKESIIQRQNMVQTLIDAVGVREQLQDVLKQIGDLERIVGRIALNRASAYDYVLLKHALLVLHQLPDLLKNHTQQPLVRIVSGYCLSFKQLANLLDRALNDDASAEWIIKSAFDQNLDYLRDLAENSNRSILDLEKTEQQQTGIASLKIRYNQVHGYYIEVTKANAHLVPERFIRSQTLVGKERFTTVELKKLESEIIQARLEVERVEQAVFDRIKKEVSLQVTQLRKLTQTLAQFDGLLGFATVAASNGYVRPTFNENNKITIIEGRHPIVEQKLGNRFIPNDTQLHDEQRLLIITGPNMGGKSTYLRQVALQCIMAQCGSFVPAKKADVPLLDRIFTRIGAGDNVADGESTFLVEMKETAIICSYATERSLVILDEVGRGTSTFDGLAIAQAVVEYIYQAVKAHCLFATHYHELTQLEQQFSGIASYHAASKKTANGMLLLYKILPGSADGSFGIDVARLAQLPPAVIERADAILTQLTDAEKTTMHIMPAIKQVATQKLKEKITDLEAKLKAKDEYLSRLHSIDLEELSPKKAFDLLWDLKERSFSG